MRPHHQSPRNGEPTPSPSPRHPFGLDLSPQQPQFQSTLSLQKLRRLSCLVLLLRLAAFCFSLASAVFMAADFRGPRSPSWYDFDAFRYVFAANAIVTVYSLFELGVAVWEIARSATLFPEVVQVWFDFGHDQVFAYMLLSAGSAGAALARTLKGSGTCTAASSFCVQADIALALGFAGFLFLGFSCLLSGFRVACFIIRGSRFHL